jgi:hypothetical protein
MTEEKEEIPKTSQESSQNDEETIIEDNITFKDLVITK